MIDSESRIVFEEFRLVDKHYFRLVDLCQGAGLLGNTDWLVGEFRLDECCFRMRDWLGLRRLQRFSQLIEVILSINNMFVPSWFRFSILHLFAMPIHRIQHSFVRLRLMMRCLNT